MNMTCYVIFITHVEDESFKNAGDLMFDELEERDSEHFAVRQYAKYKLVAGANGWYAYDGRTHLG
jgi:hypothetical protein